MGNNPFEDLIDSFSDDVEKQSIRNIASKYPELKNGYLRQSDYSRSMNELKADKDRFNSEKTRIEADLGKLEEWKAWSLNNWDSDHKMTKAEVAKVKQIEELNSELEILKQAQEAGMTFEEVGQYLDGALAKKNLVSRDYLEKEFKTGLVDQASYKRDLDAKIAGVANGLDYLYSATLPAVLKHKDEFGEILAPTEIIKYANEHGINKIEDAYESMVAPRRAEISAKKNEEAIKKARDEGRAEALKEKGMGSGGQVPVDNGPPVMGHMERRLRGPKEEQLQEIEGPLGTISNQVAARYRKDKAEGKGLPGAA
jgi:hypothetical protein